MNKKRCERKNNITMESYEENRVKWLIDKPRIGFSSEIVHNLTQNMVHKFMNTPYYMSYDEFRRGGYFYTGYRNPLSLWDR